MGVLIGTQQTKDNYEGEWKTQVGSTLASTGGSLTLAAGDTAHLTTADIFGQQGVTLTGQEVLVDGATNEAHEKRTHEESRSGLSLSLSNSAISAGETFRGAVRTAQSRDNKTLQGLELVEAGRNLRKDLKGKSPADVTSVGLHVGIGSSSFKQESEVKQQTYAGGRMMSAGDVTVRAESSPKNKGNLTAVGESIQGKNVSLTASGSVRLQAGTNEETIRDSYQSHGASIGASFHGGLTSIDASYDKMKDQGTTTRVTHTGSHVTAQDSLMTSSGKDTTLVGSQLQGQSVTVKTGGNLHIESVQDSETYRGNHSSTGISFEAKSENASYSRGKTTSDYASVTEQAGIYAGDQGYDVDVNKDTQLKGAVIASTADANRNHLTTGTLHLEDIQNKAAYDVKNTGVAYNHYASDQERNQHFNETGLTPDILPGATKDAHSVTRSAISQGTIQVTQGAMDVTKINRDTAHALQTLDHIFDKQKVEERQELARLFAKNADELLHYYDRDGKFDKALAHGLVAEITGRIAGNKAGSGFAAGMTNELLINKIKEWAGNDPAKAQWISATLGATVNVAVGKNIQTGGATAQYGTKWNDELAAEVYAAALLLEDGAGEIAGATVGSIGVAGALILGGTQEAGGDVSYNTDANDWNYESVLNVENNYPNSGSSSDDNIDNYDDSDTSESVSTSPESVPIDPPVTYQEVVAEDGSIHKMGSDGSNIVTGKYQIDGHLYSDDGGYDQLHRRFLTGIDTGNLYSGYYQTADREDDWKELPYDRIHNKFGNIELSNPQNETAQLLDVTYGEESVLDGADIVYSAPRKMYVDTKMEAPIPVSFVNEHKDKIIPSSLPPAAMQVSDDGFTAIPPAPKKPNDADLALIGSGIALSQPVQRKVPVPDNAMTRYSADVLKENVLSTGDDTVLKAVGKDLKPLGTLDDFYTAREDVQNYIVPYGHIFAVSDFFLPTAGGAYIGYFAGRLGYDPLVNTILGKVMISRILDSIKNDNLKNLKKRK